VTSSVQDYNVQNTCRRTGNMEEQRVTWNDELKNISIATLFVFTVKLVVVNIIWIVLVVGIFAACTGGLIGSL